jgi:2-iminobutanoate/2-iminopropanoate deaminase
MFRAAAAFAVLATLAVGAGAPLATASAADAPERLNSGKVLPPGLPFAEAVRYGDVLYLSGQVGVTPGALQLVPGGFEPEAKQTLDNIRTTLAANGLTMADLIRCTVMLADMADWPRFNEIWRTYFDGRFPARSALGASGLALGARVEIECTAAAPRRGRAKS